MYVRVYHVRQSVSCTSECITYMRLYCMSLSILCALKCVEVYYVCVMGSEVYYVW